MTERCSVQSSVSVIMDVRARVLLFLALNHALVECMSPKSYKLNDGNDIPAVALGTSLGHLPDGTRVLPVNSSLARAVQWALEAGYRHVDTAALYRVEDEVGLGVRNFINNGGAHRHDLYITTKLWNDAHERDEVLPALRNSLDQLQMDYVDLYLVHYPMAYTYFIIAAQEVAVAHLFYPITFERNFYDSHGKRRRLFQKPHAKPGGNISHTDYLTTWKGMEDARMMNLTKSIGVSNFNLTQMKRLWDNSRIKPAVLQIEVNPTTTQDELVDWCHDHGVVVMAYSPFGAILGRKKDGPEPRADHPLLQRLADKYNKTVPQILLRYLLDRNMVPIPRSTNKQRITQNINILDFSLKPEEVHELSGFNSNYRLRTPVKWYNHPHFPFEKKNLTTEQIKHIIEHSKED